MEEILLVIIQFLIEVVGQVLLELPFEFGDWRRSELERGSWQRYTAALLLGGLIGGISLWFFPHTMLHQPWLRLANLVAAPLLSAALAHTIASSRMPQRSHIVPAVHGWTAFCFTLGVATVRFAYTSH